ncbi:MAG TPA: twin-arginine translocase TatA/TatE family subunit [Acidimicrobiales bacterium]|nr:twin-arginine translocase TatA/TatE family subunit [Acidimicrobiales bacterium]
MALRPEGRKRDTGMLAEIFAPADIIVVLVVLLLVFGGSQLPKLARSLGSASHEFKKGLDEGGKDDAGDEAKKDANAASEQASKSDGDGTATSKG